MAFFVEVDQESNSNNSQDNETPERLDLRIIASAKKMSLSFWELNEFTVNDFIKFADIYTGREKEKKATQEDIDSFFGTS